MNKSRIITLRQTEDAVAALDRFAEKYRYKSVYDLCNGIIVGFVSYIEGKTMDDSKSTQFFSDIAKLSKKSFGDVDIVFVTVKKDKDYISMIDGTSDELRMISTDEALMRMIRSYNIGAYKTMAEICQERSMSVSQLLGHMLERELQEEECSGPIVDDAEQIATDTFYIRKHEKTIQ